METAHNSNWESLQYYGIDHVAKWERGGNREQHLRRRESKWILTVGTVQPDGLNADTELHVHL